MEFIIYKTKNLITGQEYIGQHVSRNINDGYIGSGTRLWNSIGKYGKSNFSREVLFVYDNFDDMNNKEIELVNEDWVFNPNSLNVVLGGIGFNTAGTFPVFDITLNKFIRVHREEFDESIHTTMNKNKVLVKFVDDNETDDWFFITREEYSLNKNMFETPSTGKVSVFDNEENVTKSITVEERYESPNRYTPVSGGIVANVNGKNMYVSKEQFINENLVCLTKGKVTVIEKATGRCFDVSCDEYKVNKHLYKTNSTGKCTAVHKITGDSIRIDTSEKELYKDEYNFSTHGQVTVFSIADNRYMNISRNEYRNNKHLYRAQTSGLVVAFDTTKDRSKFSTIPREEYNKEIHKLPKDVYFEFYNEGNLVAVYFGSKSELGVFLLKQFNIKLSKSNKSLMFSTNEINVENKHFKIIEIDWKQKYGIKKTK